MRKIVLVIIAMLVASAAHGAPDMEYKFTADGGLRVAPVASAGPTLIEVRANGQARITIHDTQQAAPTVVLRRSWPGNSTGLAYFETENGEVQYFYFQGDSADSVTIDMVTATECRVRCNYGNI